MHTIFVSAFNKTSLIQSTKSLLYFSILDNSLIHCLTVIGFTPFIHFYNNKRLHSNLRYMTPNEFYRLYSGEQLTNINVRV
ncbi:TPA: IS3 family transposase [Clostridium botulinum]|uniref:IS3 family transposase n=1 Tax=Clostridium botulinum TaxID=1491 RepID=UPI0035C7F658